jgi:drug/metabolite transporter (DMT)-like permease
LISVGIEPLIGAALALASALAWSGLDALRKKLARDLSASAILLGLMAAQLPVHIVVLATVGCPSADLTFAGVTLITAALTLAANLLFVRAVAISPLSLTVPYLSFTPVLTLLFGAVILDQRPGPAGLAGVIAVTVGALLLNTTPREVLRDPLLGLRREAGSRIMLGVACLFAVSTALDRVAITHASEPAYALALTGSISLGLLARRGVAREVVRARPLHGWLALGALATAAALLTQFLGYRYIYVAYVDAVKRAGGNILAVLLGAVLFSESLVPRRLVATILMSIGVSLVLFDPVSSP